MTALGVIILVVASALGIAIFIALDAGYVLPQVPGAIRAAAGGFVGFLCFGLGLKFRAWLNARSRH